MPVKPLATAKTSPWHTAQPGDIFFTTGAGLVGALVRRGTSSPYGHCGIIEADGFVDEAFPSFPPWRAGLRVAARSLETVAAIARVWRTEEERQTILTTSRAMVEQDLPYAWSEITVIAAANILPHSWIPMTDVSRAVICSNHVAQCIRAARPDDYDRYFRYPPNLMWPGGLHYDLQAMLWDDERG